MTLNISPLEPARTYFGRVRGQMYNETEYWLELLFRSEYIEEKPYLSVVEDCRELIRLLISIVKTSKGVTEKD